MDEIDDVKVGDAVTMPGTPFVVGVLELGICEDGDDCEFGPTTFRFTDPHTGEDDWMHVSEFEKVRV